MMWLFAILIVLALGGVALLAAGKGRPMAEVYDDRPDATVPRDGALGPDDLRTVRFSLAFRGYRMSEVDTLLDRLADQLADASGPGALDPVVGPEAGPAAGPTVGPTIGPTIGPGTAWETDSETPSPPARGDGGHTDG